MAQRRSFLGGLLALWPFTRAGASSLGTATTQAQPAPPSPSENTVEKALKACIDKVTEGTKVHGTNLDFDDKDEQGKPKEKDKTPLGKLEKYCRKAFEDCLSGEGGEGRWDHDKERVLDLAWRVGVAARTVREGRGDKKRKVIFAYDVRMGLKFVNEHCQMQCGPTNDARQRIQRAYCLGALDKDGWPEEDAPGPDK